MHVIAESGATTTDWVLYDESGERKTFRTAGINPNVMSPEAIAEGPVTEFRGMLNSQKLQSIVFYGAGLGTAAHREVLRNILKAAFSGVRIATHHDMLAAARAACGDAPGIVCILGTGSNSCRYDGTQVVETLGGHGYILGDEGSGADLGKYFLKAMLDDEMEADLVAAFEAWMGESLIAVRTKMYHHEQPNAYLASFSKFIAQHVESVDALYALVRERFAEFLVRTVVRYPDAREVPVHFIGSVAHYYRGILEAELEDFQLEVGKIIRAPVGALVQYHIDQLS